jgi:hypothetical protein
MKFSREWEEIDDTTERLRVLGGWIVRSSIDCKSGVSISQVYIPDPNYGWVLETEDEDSQKEVKPFYG